MRQRGIEQGAKLTGVQMPPATLLMAVNLETLSCMRQDLSIPT